MTRMRFALAGKAAETRLADAGEESGHPSSLPYASSLEPRVGSRHKGRTNPDPGSLWVLPALTFPLGDPG
jgi:hypothetical protein